MKKFIFMCGPFSSRSGYGNHARDIYRSLYKLEDYEIKCIDVRWGDCPRNALAADNELNNSLKASFVNQTPQGLQLDRQPDIYIDIRIPNEFLQVGNYLALVYKNSDTGEVFSELLKVYCISGYDVITIKPKDYDESIEYEILRFGFAENYNRGITTKDKNSLFSYSGKRACCVKKQCSSEDNDSNSDCPPIYNEDDFS